MSMIKIGGKSASGNAVPVKVDNNGAVFQKHIWEVETITIVNAAITDNSGHIYPESTTNMDVSDYALMSMRVRNRADVPVNIRITYAGNYIQNANGDPYSLDIAAGGQVIITGDDLSCLNALPGFQIRYQYNTAPTNGGKLEIYLYKKR